MQQEEEVEEDVQVLQVTNAVAIFPRNKKTGPRQSPVFLTRHDLVKLFPFKLEEAAESLGLSLTALRNACRKLGIYRWPYARAGGASITGSREHQTTSSAEHADFSDDIMQAEASASGGGSSHEGVVTSHQDETASSQEDQVGADPHEASEGDVRSMEEGKERRFIEWYANQKDEDEESVFYEPERKTSRLIEKI
ncbi:hypothetical protein GUITHDRAFT_115696 [Guillardia theta CCMP2712]|uniref:RWP-RK domain-containing protein n=1 Tax=Guillardia theta (strain CCMP2712) TaxID=905079 RepID=L1IPF4_GUITC|nr:hypothetical protein GUITHDRAFT_115696 [Guillardia theta CCMP2712]EKX38143.1 hypothetical protein GUITHDRAFT_115696 [Guillardia theta CCMP2712]|eukprot:XP_005825123.1 hypothetical protein GUITHDRAFT_115696 [Guillardia theta CCMP2712]